MTHRRGVMSLIIRCFCVLAPLTALGLTREGEAPLTPGALTQELSAEENYKRQCAACHGDEGRGDGRVSRRYNPRPSDFRDPNGVLLMSDDELNEIITDGRASMPAFDEVLTAEEIAAVTAYVRVLSGQIENGPEASERPD